MIRFIKRDSSLGELELVQLRRARESVMRYGFDVYAMDMKKFGDTFEPQHSYLIGVIGKEDIEGDVVFTGFVGGSKNDVYSMIRGYNMIFKNGANFYIAIHKDERII